MKKLLLFIFVIGIFYSCSNFVYYPSVANAPLHQEKNDTKVSLGLKGYSGYLTTSYAIGNNLALQVNGHYLNLKVTELGEELINKNSYAETALGLYFPFANKLVAEIYTGVGLGSTGYENLTSISVKDRQHNKIFIQADIGFTTPFFNAGLVLKGTYVNVFNETIDGVNTGIQYMDIFFEPAVFVKFGWEQHKINIQAGLSDSYFTNISYAPFILALGYEYSFKF